VVIKLDLKKLLKSLKLNESSISMVLGIGVIVLAGIFVVNYFKKSNTGTTVPGANTQELAKPEVGGKYTVKKGDSLWNIAEEAYNSGYNWVDIANENGLKNPSDISEGQELSLPVVASKVETKSVLGEVIKEDVVSNKIEGSAYTVVKGDNLWKIAVRAYGDGYKWVEIAKLNKLTNPGLIHPGNVLTLPR
jgi:nucleoid-associated protein YgaU